MMKAPSFRSAISGPTMFISQRFDITLFCMIFWNTSSFRPLSGPKYGLEAALQTMMSIRP